jgi:hypothetical protein
MRQFIRHPIDMPVEIGMHEICGQSALQAHDISLGGLALHSEQALHPGTRVRIRIAHVEPPFEAPAQVAWCQANLEEGFELGVTFLDADDAFLARMVEQVCHIEDYRRSVQRTEGRNLSAEEAATEWIDRYAAQFPPLDPAWHH